MAHQGEAQEFIKRKFRQEVEFHFKGLYRSDDDMLLIGGEGIQKTTMRTTAVYTYFSHQIDRIINMGVAGSLNQKLQLNQIYGIRNVHHELEQYPSFACKETLSKMACVSSLHPVLKDQYAKKLKKKADMVDQELWAIGAVCAMFSLPFKSYKLISDQAGDLTDSKDIMKRAPYYSKHLFDFYKKLSLAKEMWDLDR
jgi:nucleoside phosphorylase